MAHIQVRTAPDSELLDATRSGNLDAYGELWNRHAQAAETASRNFAPSLDAQDLVSEAFLKIFRALKAGKGPTDSFRPYMYRVLRSLSADWLQERDPIATSTREPIDAIPDTDTAWPWEDGVLDGEIAVQAFHALDERWKSVLWYTEVEQLPPREVAKLIGVSPNGVSKLAARAREGLRFAWIEAHLANKRHLPECERALRLLLRLQRGRLSARHSAELHAHLDGCAFCRNAAYELDTAKRRIGPALLLLIVGSGSSALFLDTFAGATPASAAALVPPEFLTSGDAVMHSSAAVAAGATAAGASGGFAGSGSASAGSAGVKGFLALLRSPTNAIAAGGATVLGAAGAIAIAAGVFAPTNEETTAAPAPDTSVSAPRNSDQDASVTDPQTLKAETENPALGTSQSPSQDAGSTRSDDYAGPVTGNTSDALEPSGGNGASGIGPGEKPGSDANGDQDGSADGGNDGGSGSDGETPGDDYDHSLFPNQLCFFETSNSGSIHLAGVASHPGYVKVRITQPPALHPVELIVADNATTGTGFGNWWYTQPLNPLENWPGLVPGDIRATLVEVQLLTLDGRKSPWYTVTLPEVAPPIEACGLDSTR